MWIQHPDLGAFSIVLADDLNTGQPDPTRLMIRARRREHLQLLQERCVELAEVEIIETVGTDYRWRLIVEKAAFGNTIAEIVGEIGYRNMKARAQTRETDVGGAFVTALHRVWSVLKGIQ